MYECVCTYACVCVCVHVCMLVCMLNTHSHTQNPHTYMHKYSHTYMRKIHTHTHTHTHTDTHHAGDSPLQGPACFLATLISWLHAHKYRWTQNLLSLERMLSCRSFVRYAGPNYQSLFFSSSPLRDARLLRIIQACMHRTRMK